MGVVYRAWQPSLGRQVALKCMLKSGDPKAEARFAREIRALGRVEHPGVVKVFTSGSEADQWFFAMELVEGADLARVCEQLSGRKVTEVDDTTWREALTSACAAARSSEVPLSDSEPGGRAAGPGADGDGGAGEEVAPRRCAARATWPRSWKSSARWPRPPTRCTRRGSSIATSSRATSWSGGTGSRPC